VSSNPLPEPVRRYLARAIPTGPAPRQVRITQTGQMRKTPDAKPMRFTATQWFAVDHIGFSWQARFPIVGPLAMKVVDEFSGGQGNLVVRLLGFPINRQKGLGITAGEAVRYLAELPLVPFAMTHNRDLEWRALDDRAMEVSATVDDEHLAVRFDVDESGDIVRASSISHPMGNDGGVVPWGGEFREYQTFNGIRIPTQAEVYWDLPAGRFVYWTGTITSVAALDQPFSATIRRPHRTHDDRRPG
jgi:hypothetical protein